MAAASIFADSNIGIGPWKGNAVLGSGNVCVVYSDDPGICSKSGVSGIQHFYIDDYTVDFIRGTSISFDDIKTNKTLLKSTLSPFYRVHSKYQHNGIFTVDEYTLVDPSGIVITEYAPDNSNISASFRIEIGIREEFVSSRITRVVKVTEQGQSVTYYWDNGKALNFLCSGAQMKLTREKNKLIFSGQMSGKKSIFLTIAPVSEQKKKPKRSELSNLRKLMADAGKFWAKTLDTVLHKFPPTSSNTHADEMEFLKRTVYSVLAASLNAMIPADMTGQFVTNAMPQLYPRDALKCARVFFRLGLPGAAAKIIRYWCGGGVPHKSPGEFFARYDAYGDAVDAGSGARYDEPEWDANGYLLTLLRDYHTLTGVWLTESACIYSFADFIARNIDSTGLLFEGGIVEWTGYLPTTNMVCAAGLTAAAEMAQVLGDSLRAIQYRVSAGIISQNMHKTFDSTRRAYCAVRFSGKKATDNSSFSGKGGEKNFLWDGTAQFGFLWGYPRHPELDSTIRFYEQNTVRPGGGLQYFEALDPGLSAYGNDIFFFTTASLAQYYARTSQKEKARLHIKWMINNSNTYGLMPERIYLNGTDCSEASPLSWCNAEFAAAVYEYLLDDLK